MHEVEAKHLLSAKNGMNIYRGCSHGCIYCDARSACYQMKHAFEDIEVKVNAPQLLEEELRRKRKPCMVGTGAMSDPYMHIEETLELTRRCLAVIRDHHCGVAIQTKSDRILRDLDLLKQINDEAKCVVQITITTFDDRLCKIIEPNVCPTSERLHILEVMQQNRIPTVVWMTPILPYINDTVENVAQIVHACGKRGVYGILDFGLGLTLRDGDRQYYYANLDRHFPGIKEKYIRRYGTAYELPSENYSRISQVFYELCDTYGIETDSRKIFDYMHTYESRLDGEQLSLFE